MDVEFKAYHTLSTDELYRIYKLRTDVFVVEQNCAYPEVDETDLKSIHVFLGTAELIAYLRIYRQGHESHIGRVVVAPEHRGNGYARRIMRSAIDAIRETDSTSVRLSAQTYLVPFYESLGFDRIGKEYPDYGIPHVDMSMNLK